LSFKLLYLYITFISIPVLWRRCWKIRLNFPTSENYQKFELNITNHDKRVVYYYFHIFWTIHSDALNEGRILFAQYIKTYFTNFSDAKIPTLKESLRAHEVQLLSVLAINKYEQLKCV
jgi:hypothetical protein